MKKLVLSLYVLSTSVALAQSSPVAGSWKVHSSIAGNESDSDCVFTVADKKIGGTCSIPDAKPVAITGTVDGTKVAWMYKTDYNGTELTITYTGALAGDKIAGTQAVDPFAIEGEFTATRSK